MNSFYARQHIKFRYGPLAQKTLHNVLKRELVDLHVAQPPERGNIDHVFKPRKGRLTGQVVGIWQSACDKFENGVVT